MRAAVFTSNKQPLEVREVGVPDPGQGEVRIEVARVGICGSDLHAKELGSQPEGLIFGHEFAGVVSDIGPGVSDWSVGDRVVSLPIYHCGHCEQCDAGVPGLCKEHQFIGFSLDHGGAYAQFTVAPTDTLHRVPDSVGFDAAALVEPLSVSRRAVARAPLNKDSVVLVIGTGPIGAGVIQFARLAGARTVIVSELSQERRDLALAMGASDVIDPASGNLADLLMQVAGRLPDVIFECVGVPGMIQQAVSSCALGGTIVVVGVCMVEDRFMPMLALTRELTLKFSNCYGPADFDAVLDALASGKLEPSAMLTEVVPLADAPDAFEKLMRDKTGCKTLIDPSAGKF